MSSAEEKNIEARAIEEFNRHSYYFESIKSKDQYLKMWVKCKWFKHDSNLTDDTERTVEAFFDELHKKCKASSLWSYYGKIRKCLIVMRYADVKNLSPSLTRLLRSAQFLHTIASFTYMHLCSVTLHISIA